MFVCACNLQRGVQRTRYAHGLDDIRVREFLETVARKRHGIVTDGQFGNIVGAIRRGISLATESGAILNGRDVRLRYYPAGSVSDRPVQSCAVDLRVPGRRQQEHRREYDDGARSGAQQRLLK